MVVPIKSKFVLYIPWLLKPSTKIAMEHYMLTSGALSSLEMNMNQYSKISCWNWLTMVSVASSMGMGFEG